LPGGLSPPPRRARSGAAVFCRYLAAPNFLGQPFDDDSLAYLEQHEERDAEVGRKDEVDELFERPVGDDHRSVFDEQPMSP
jgi:hypothetical protein